MLLLWRGRDMLRLCRCGRHGRRGRGRMLLRHWLTRRAGRLLLLCRWCHVLGLRRGRRAHRIGRPTATNHALAAKLSWPTGCGNRRGAIIGAVLQNRVGLRGLEVLRLGRGQDAVDGLACRLLNAAHIGALLIHHRLDSGLLVSR